MCKSVGFVGSATGWPALQTEYDLAQARKKQAIISVTRHQNTDRATNATEGDD